ncbi:MAG: undecaprenyl-diphosphate phosphatase [Gammaproteobacteria bacterium]
MDTSQAFILALVQGFTEFLPISSSAHLILMPVLAGWQDQGLAFDVAVHVGTLAAVVLYYRQELWSMAADLPALLRGRPRNPQSRILGPLVIGTFPVGLAGLFLHHDVELYLRSPLVIAGTTIIFAILLWWADKKGRGSVDDSAMTWKEALWIGVFQALALIPGTSRSGITITAALLFGFTREFSARFSFLLSIPVIALAGSLKGLELLQSPGTVGWGMVSIGVFVSAVTAYLTIGWFLTLIERIGLLPFVVYRFVLGAVLIFVFI